MLAILLDALDPDLARKLAAAGAMPVLARLLERAASAPVENTEGFYVGSIWPSFATGTSPGTHGQYCWRQFDPVTYREEAPPYHYGDAEPFWATLDRAGLRCLVVDAPLSIPVPLEHGISVHDHSTHDPLGPGYCTWPEALRDELVRVEDDEALDICNEWPRASTDDVRAFVARLEGRIERKIGLVRDLLARGPFDVAVLGLSEAHCVGHSLWHVHDAGHERHDPRLLREVGDPLRRVYAKLDEALGQLLDEAGPETHVLVLASHGMGPHHDGSHLLDALLERVEPGLPGVRPLSWRERFMRLRARGPRTKGGIHALWRRWPARRFRSVFSVSNNEAWGAVRVNLVGRESHGRVDRASFDDVLERVADALRRARNPDGGTPAFHRIQRTKDLVSGPQLDALPDLVAEWARDRPFRAIEIPGIGGVRAPYRGVRTGDHRPHGLALVLGPGLGAGKLESAPVGIMDLAPTIVSWLGVDFPRAQGRAVDRWAAEAVSLD